MNLGFAGIFGEQLLTEYTRREFPDFYFLPEAAPVSPTATKKIMKTITA